MDARSERPGERAWAAPGRRAQATARGCEAPSRRAQGPDAIG